MSSVAFPESKTSSIPGDQVGKHDPGRSVSFGQEPGSTGARSKGGGLENTAAILFQAPLWGTRGGSPSSKP